MSLSTLSAPDAEPISVDDDLMRLHLRLGDDETDEDSLVTQYIATARHLTETYLRRRLITQTVRLTLDGFGAREIVLPIAPVQKIDEVQYLDDAGAWQTVETATYRLIESCEPNTLSLDLGQSWPTPRLGKASVRVDMVVGYGDAGADVPPQFLHAICKQVAHMFENRGDTGSGQDLVQEVRDLLQPWVLWV